MARIDSACEGKLDESRLGKELITLIAQRLSELRQRRDNKKVNNCLDNIKDCSVNGQNLMPAVIEAVEHYATLGEIANELREVWGEYKG